MPKSLGFDRLSVLILVLVLAFSVKLYHETTLNPVHEFEKYRGWDVDTYVNLAVNETYQPFPGEPAIERKNEGPLVFLMLYPAVILGGYNGFFLFMAFFSTLTGLLIYMLAEKIKPRSGLFAAWCWLFNPLNYRLSMDLAANMLVNFFGVALVLLAVMTAREPTSIWRAEPFGGQNPPNLDDNSRLNAKFRRQQSSKRKIPIYIIAVFCLVLSFFTHQLWVYWVAMTCVVALMGEKHLLVAMTGIAAATLVASLFTWRAFIMLALPTTLLLIYLPEKWRPATAVIFFAGYLVSPWLFGVPIP